MHGPDWHLRRGRLPTPDSTRLSKWVQLTLRKFHLFSGLEGIDEIGLSKMISEGLCCDLGKWSRMMWEEAGPSKLINARSGLDFSGQSGSYRAALGHREGAC